MSGINCVIGQNKTVCEWRKQHWKWQQNNRNTSLARRIYGSRTSGQGWPVFSLMHTMVLKTWNKLELKLRLIWTWQLSSLFWQSELGFDKTIINTERSDVYCLLRSAVISPLSHDRQARLQCWKNNRNKTNEIFIGYHQTVISVIFRPSCPGFEAKSRPITILRQPGHYSRNFCW